MQLRSYLLLASPPVRWTRKQVQDMINRDSDRGRRSQIWGATDEDSMETVEGMVDDVLGSGPIKPMLDWITQHCPTLLETRGLDEDELLVQKLVSLGGKRSEPEWEALSQLQSDPDCMAILRGGQVWGRAGIHEILDEGACHWNVSKLFTEGRIDAIVLGYAMGPGLVGGMWHQHTWGLRDNQVVETTESNTGDTKYFGVVLSPSQAQAFAEKCERSRRGQGVIRTFKGGPNA